ncbi:lanthionine synthetase LanC family protein [Sorangium sp. So ce426]|uniref:lanthionine synthetase LanC family protein n=1 Tax=Sorangium sp. So ce426 TaxID=3133312 RepID=UPI003F5BA001
MSVRIEEGSVFLHRATQIGRELCDVAFWDEGRTRCTWMGRTDVEDAGAGPAAVATAVIGDHVYAGTAGIALFLAELFLLTGDVVFERTALGALRQAIEHFDAGLADRASPLSFFSGQLGVAYAAHRLEQISPSAHLGGEIDRMLELINAACSTPHLLDVMGGNAGAIPALLALADTSGRQWCLELAHACGRELCATVAREGSTCWWDAQEASGMSASRPLTGLSHGASGMALALLELYGALGDAEFLAMARGAFAYEDLLFDPTQKNWQDVRSRPSASPGGNVFQSAWCHGAPGIALARLRAMRLDRERADAHAAMARVGLEATVAAIEQRLGMHRHDATLCHGLTGLCEVALIAGEALDEERYRLIARSAAEALASRHESAWSWPSGAPAGGPNPTLLIGAAGIGHHLLRLQATEDVPPILCIMPSDVARRQVR